MKAKDLRFRSSSDEENITHDCSNAFEMIECREREIKSEEEQRTT